MKGYYRWIAVFSVAVFGVMGLSACELSETCDPTVTICDTTDAGNDQGNNDTGVDQGNFQAYHYVLIEDRDQNPSGDRPGADIDAVELNSHGSRVYLSQIHSSGFGDERPSGPNSDFNNALGSPEGGCSSSDPADWDRENFVSLGGDGGYFVASFQGLAEIKAGDVLSVHACSARLSEEWDVSVGVATSLNDPNWFMVVNGGVAAVDVTIPNLPLVPGN